MHPTPLGNLQFLYLEHLTLLMCFDIGVYNRMSVAKILCGKALRMLSMKHHNFGFPRNAQHFHLCLILLVIVQFFKSWYKGHQESFILISAFTLLLQAWVCGRSFLGLWVRIPLGAWKPVSWECCVLSGRGLCIWLVTRPAESNRVFCV